MPSGIRIVALGSDEGASVVAAIRGSGATALLGSGISSFAPTSLPTGQMIATRIARRLAEGGVSGPELLARLVSATAFEHVMERCPRPGIVCDLFSKRFGKVPPNDLHRAFVRLLESGTLRHIVTTNYDIGIEVAAAERPAGAKLTPIRDEREAAAARSAGQALYKIHGCATPPFAARMVFRLRDEAQLAPWKYDTLKRLVAGYPFLVVGYSGMDFEISPTLSGLGASGVVWLHFGDPRDLTPNARRVLRETGGTLLLGNAESLLGALFDEPPIDTRWAPQDEGFIEDLFTHFDSEDLDVWRARLFGEIGCGRDAVWASERLLAAAESRGDTNAVAYALTRRAQGLFHQGRHFDAARSYARAARLAKRTGDLHELRDALNGIVESNRCAGRMARTWLALRRVRRFARGAGGTPEHASARADSLMLGVVFRRHAYQIASSIPKRKALVRMRRWLRGWIRGRAEQDLRTVATLAAESGNWLQLQQARLWAPRYHLHWNRVYRGPMKILPSRDGYRQLGYVVARSMAIRDRSHPPDGDEIRELLPALAEIGAFPEAWKLLAFATRRSRLDGISEELQEQVRSGWEQCQYAAWMRRALEREATR